MKKFKKIWSLSLVACLFHSSLWAQNSIEELNSDGQMTWEGARHVRNFASISAMTVTGGALTGLLSYPLVVEDGLTTLNMQIISRKGRLEPLKKANLKDEARLIKRPRENRQAILRRISNRKAWITKIIREDKGLAKRVDILRSQSLKIPLTWGAKGAAIALAASLGARDMGNKKDDIRRIYNGTKYAFLTGLLWQTFNKAPVSSRVIGLTFATVGGFVLSGLTVITTDILTREQRVQRFSHVLKSKIQGQSAPVFSE